MAQARAFEPLFLPCLRASATALALGTSILLLRDRPYEGVFLTTLGVALFGREIRDPFVSLYRLLRRRKHNGNDDGPPSAGTGTPVPTPRGPKPLASVARPGSPPAFPSP